MEIVDRNQFFFDYGGLTLTDIDNMGIKMILSSWAFMPDVVFGAQKCARQTYLGPKSSDFSKENVSFKQL